jgi:rhodanese-related sulfurtransferase
MKKHILLLNLLAIGMITLVGCSNAKDTDKTDSVSEETETILEKISAEEAKAKMEASKDIIILDVRTEEEYSEGHIEGAILLPDYEISEKATEILKDMDATILVYCRSGRRSAISAQELSDLGYTSIYDFGGILDWPYDIVN